MKMYYFYDKRNNVVFYDVLTEDYAVHFSMYTGFKCLGYLKHDQNFEDLFKDPSWEDCRFLEIDYQHFFAFP